MEKSGLEVFEKDTGIFESFPDLWGKDL